MMSAAFIHKSQSKQGPDRRRNAERRIRSFRFIRQEISLSYWLPVLIAVVAFFAYPIRLYLALNINNLYAEKGKNYDAMIRSLRLQVLESSLGTGDLITIFAVGVASLLCACTMFYYLDSREKTDFYHSLALTRAELYRAKFAAGWIAAAVPYLVNVLGGYFLFGGIYGLLTRETLRTVASAVLFFLLAFSAIYAVCILAMILTGRLLTGILTGVFFLGYGPACFLLMRSLILDNFVTYSSYTDKGSNVIWLLSPFSLMLLNREKQQSSLLGTSFPVMAYHQILPALFLAAYFILSVFLGMFLYKRRRSEAAESSLCYHGFGACVKLLVSIPGGIAFGELFSRSADAGSVSWAVFSVIGVFLINGIIEFIYSRDLKSVPRHWVSLAAEFAGTALLLTLMIVNPFGYDSWLPETDQIRSMSMIPSGGGISILGEYSYGDMSRNAIPMLKDTETGDFAAIYGLAEEGVKNAASAEDSGYDPNVCVMFRMKNGRVVYRQYQVSDEQLQKTENELSAASSWRKKIYPTNFVDPSAIESVEICPWEIEKGPGTAPDLNEDEIRGLIQALREDSNETDLEAIQEENPAGTILFTPKNWSEGISEENNRVDVYSLYIYPEYRRTLEFLKNYGIDLQGNTSGPEETEKNGSSGILSVSVQNQDSSYLISDAGEISEFLRHITQIRYDYTNDGENSDWWYLSVSYEGTQNDRSEYFIPDDEAVKILEKNIANKD
ncbi:MAG: DUF6449 domain-containing protein [Bilifractor sp.]|jgi:ABC-2 type transport system permease protein